MTTDNDSPASGETGRRGQLNTTLTFLVGIIVGLALVGLALFGREWLVSASNWNIQLILIAGLGIILFSFGSMASGKVMGWTVSGSAAIVIALLYVSADIQKRQITRGSISGSVINPEATIEVISSKILLGAFRDRRYRFIALAEELEEPVSVHLTIGDQDLPRLDIPSRFVQERESVDWEWDNDKGELREKSTGTRIVKLVNFQSRNRSGSTPGEAFEWRLLPRAYAYEPPTDFDSLLRNLESDTAMLRREARSGLAAQGVRSVARLADLYANDQSSYRIKLGALVALTEMLRRYKDARIQIAAKLTDTHLKAIATGLASEDRTTRIYASEFLYDLADPRSVNPVLDTITSQGVNEDGQYLGVFVLDSIVQRTPAALNQQKKDELRQFSFNAGPRTNALINSIIGEPSIEDLAGSYTGEWWSEDRPSYYGNLNLELTVKPDGSVEAEYTAHDSPIKPEGTLKGKLVHNGVEWIGDELRDGSLLVEARLNHGTIEGQYSTRIFWFWPETGRWTLERVY